MWCSHVVCALLQVFGQMGAMQVSALLEARGVRRLQYVFDEGMPIVERVLPGLSRPVAMCAQEPSFASTPKSLSPAAPDTRQSALHTILCISSTPAREARVHCTVLCARILYE